MGFSGFAEIKRANKAVGHYWFEHDPQREHRIESQLLNGRFWIESAWAEPEQRSRCYQLVAADEDGTVSYMLEARRFNSLEAARAALDHEMLRAG